MRFIFLFYCTVRCGLFFFLETYGAVRRGFVRGKIVRCGVVRLNRTEQHRTVRKKRTAVQGQTLTFAKAYGLFLLRFELINTSNK